MKITFHDITLLIYGAEGRTRTGTGVKPEGF